MNKIKEQTIKGALNILYNLDHAINLAKFAGIDISDPNTANVSNVSSDINEALSLAYSIIKTNLGNKVDNVTIMEIVQKFFIEGIVKDYTDPEFVPNEFCTAVSKYFRNYFGKYYECCSWEILPLSGYPSIAIFFNFDEDNDSNNKSKSKNTPILIIKDAEKDIEKFIYDIFFVPSTKDGNKSVDWRKIASKVYDANDKTTYIKVRYLDPKKISSILNSKDFKINACYEALVEIKESKEKTKKQKEE